MSGKLTAIMKRGVPWAVLLILVSLVMLVLLAIDMYQAAVYRDSVRAGKPVTQTFLGAHQTPQAVFANAVFYDGQYQPDQALAQYAALVSKVAEDDPLRKQAYYNSGNIYLQTAIRLLEERGLPAWDEAGPLVALAKESYQKALRIDPGWSEAKYNYHLALRLAPTTHGMSGPQQYEDDQIKSEEQPSGWPAMPGNPRGMP